MFDGVVEHLNKRTSSWLALLEQFNASCGAVTGRPSSRVGLAPERRGTRGDGDDVQLKHHAASLRIVQEGLSLVVFLQTWFVANEGRSSLCTLSLLRDVLGPFHKRVFAALAQRGVFHRPAAEGDMLDSSPESRPTESGALKDVSAVAFLVLATVLEVETFDGLSLAQDFLFEQQVYVEELSRTFSDRLIALANSGLNVSGANASEAHRPSGVRPSYSHAFLNTSGGNATLSTSILGGLDGLGNEPCGAGGLDDRIAGLSLVTTTSVLWSLLRPTKAQDTLVGPFKLFLQRRFEKLFNERSVIMYVRMHVAYLRQQPRLRVRDERSEFASSASDEQGELQQQQQLVGLLYDRQLTAVCFGVGSLLSSRLLTALCHQICIPEEVQRWTLTVEQELIVKRICHEGPPAVAEAHSQLQSTTASLSTPLGAGPTTRRDGSRTSTATHTAAHPASSRRALEALVGSSWILNIYAAAMPELLVLASEVHDDALEKFSNGVSNLAEQLRSTCLTERLFAPLFTPSRNAQDGGAVRSSSSSSAAIVLLSWATGWWMQSHIARAHSIPVIGEHAAVWLRELETLERSSSNLHPVTDHIVEDIATTATAATRNSTHTLPPPLPRRTVQVQQDPTLVAPRRTVGSPSAVDDTPRNEDDDLDSTQQQQHPPRPTLGSTSGTAARLSTANLLRSDRRTAAVAVGDGSASHTLRSFAEWMQQAAPQLLDAAAEHDAHVEHQAAMQRALETAERRSTLLDSELRNTKVELVSVRNQWMEESSAHAAQVAALAEDLRCERESSLAQQQRIRLLERQLKRFEQMSAVIRSMTSEVTSSASLSTDD